MGSGGGMGMVQNGSNQATGEPTADGIPDLGAMLLAPSKEKQMVNPGQGAQSAPVQPGNNDADDSNYKTDQSSLDLTQQMINSLGGSPSGGGNFSNPSKMYNNSGLPLQNMGMSLGG